MMSTEKRWRAFRVIETLKRQGKPVPVYGDIGLQMPKQSGKQFIKTEINMLTHFLCFMPGPFRKKVMLFFLGDGGYWLLRLNRVRRDVRTWVRDTVALMKRKIWGRG